MARFTFLVLPLFLSSISVCSCGPRALSAWESPSHFLALEDVTYLDGSVLENAPADGGFGEQDSLDVQLGEGDGLIFLFSDHLDIKSMTGGQDGGVLDSPYWAVQNIDSPRFAVSGITDNPSELRLLPVVDDAGEDTGEDMEMGEVDQDCPEKHRLKGAIHDEDGRTLGIGLTVCVTPE